MHFYAAMRSYLQRPEGFETCLGTLAILGFAAVGTILPMV
jgi:hypothetical protein